MKKYILAIILLFLFGQLLPAQGQEIAWEKISTKQFEAMHSKYYHDVSSVAVGIVDGGVDYSHPKLQGRLWDGGDKYPNHGYDFTGPDNDPKSSNPHGTWVAGIVCKMSPNAQIVALRAIDTCACSFESVFPAIVNFSIENKIKILNLSLSFPEIKINSKRMRSTIESYQNFGGLIICSAGNQKKNNDEDPQFPCSYNYDCIISVAACDQQDNLAKFSNWGEISVDVAAPGVEIESISYNRDSFTGSGTSASAPIVSALVAYLWGANPNLSAQEIKQIIMETSSQTPGLLGKISTGGKINFLEAFKKAIGPIKEEYICYDGVPITHESLINGWQQAIVNNLPSRYLEGLHTQIFSGKYCLVLAKEEIKYWKEQEASHKQCNK